MTLLESVKIRLGVFYSEENKDAEVQGLINGAVSYFEGAGWSLSTLLFSKEEADNNLIEAKANIEAAETAYENDEITESEYLEVKETFNLIKAESNRIDVLAALPIEAIVLHCKMAQSTDPKELTNHPVLISFIAQRRGANEV